MVKAIFIDIDGTLRDSNKNLSVKTIDTIKKTTEKGILVILCSGRPRKYTEQISRECFASKYIITSSGGNIYDYEQNKVIYVNKMNKEALIKLYEIANPEDVRYIMNVGEGRVVNKVKHPEQEKKLEEKNKNMSVQLQGVSEVIADLAEDIKDSKKEKYVDQKNLIKKILMQKGIVTSNIKITKNDSGRSIVNIYVENNDESPENVAKKISKVLLKVLEEKMTWQKKKSDIKFENKILTFSFISSDIYNLKVGIARAKKHDSPVSGDTSIQTKLNDGKYLLAISDGMGSGPEARKSSKIAIKMLERMLSSGFKKDVSVKMINATLSDSIEEDMYATLDILILDLYQGNIEFIKNGACPTYIKRNKEVELVNSISLPTGIINDIDLVVYDKDIKDGDIIVMCSDGIIESNTEYLHKDLWLKYFLEELQTDDVQQIADLIISEAIDNDYGKEKDDMTVIVAKVSK